MVRAATPSVLVYLIEKEEGRAESAGAYGGIILLRLERLARVTRRTRHFTPHTERRDIAC